MLSDTLFDKIGELKEKFKCLFVHKTKLKALENYSSAVAFPHKDYLVLIKRCMGNGFLGDKEAEFLSYILERYEINFLDWSHKTKWLKGEISRIKEEDQKKQIEEQLNLFDKPIQSPSRKAFEIFSKQTHNHMAGV